MQFVSVHFWIFLILACMGYYLLPGKLQYLFLLTCNGVFYWSWVKSAKGALPLLIVIAISWLGGLLLAGSGEKRRKAVLAVSVAGSLAFLLYFKYSGFITANLHRLWTLISGTSDSGAAAALPNPSVPIGISFFTFEAVGYLADVCRGKVKAERNPFRYAAFISFFPTVTSGPIERADHLLAQLQDGRKKRLKLSDLSRGIILLAYGSFTKLVVANRLSAVADSVFQNYENLGSFLLLTGSLCYTMQIFCDFLAYSILAQGAAAILGLDVVDNFHSPYLSESVQEFWRRWHISLSMWLRDYVYIPLGGSRCSAVKKNRNIFLTFLVSGIWHGADWTFVVWGMLHGLYQIAGNITKGIREKLVRILKIRTECFSFHLFRKAFVFCLVSLAWVFFRAETVSDAFRYLLLMFTSFDPWDVFNGSVYDLGLSINQWNILLAALLLLLVVDFAEYRRGKDLCGLLAGQNLAFQVLFTAGLIAATFVFGKYGPEFRAQDFLYFAF